MAGYKGKYLLTYLWSGLALVLNFFSMFIVAPLTTSMPEAYGVYSLCISFNIFLRYADMGFIVAGRKYAAEAFSVNNYALEKKYVGTAVFIYSTMSILLFLAAIFFSGYPEYLIKDINGGPYYNMAHQLLLILTFTIPLSVISKFCNLIYAVRIEEYRIQRLQIFASIIKISSVPIYFFNHKYDIVGYYLFCEILNIIVYLIILYCSKEIGYGVIEFLKCLRFDKKIFDEIKPLALGGFVSVISWIAYYELDTVGISILLGANAVAIYAIGKQIEAFVRSLVGIVFSPYPVRINYFIGQKDIGGLKVFFYNLVELFSIIIIPIVVIVLYAKPFVIAWVGHDYEQSTRILQLLVLTFIIHHIISQGSSVIYGLNKVKVIFRIAIIQPFFFWIGIFVTYCFWGVESFAFFKLAASLITGLYSCHLVYKYLNYRRVEFYWQLVVKPLVVITFVSTIVWYFTSNWLNEVNKSHQDLFFVVAVMALCCIITFLVDIRFNKSLRTEIEGVLCLLKNKKNEK